MRKEARFSSIQGAHTLACLQKWPSFLDHKIGVLDFISTLPGRLTPVGSAAHCPLASGWTGVHWLMIQWRKSGIRTFMFSYFPELAVLCVNCRFVKTSFLLFSCPVVSDPLLPHGHSTPGLSIPHHLPKFAQVHVHCNSVHCPSSCLLHPLHTSVILCMATQDGQGHNREFQQNVSHWKREWQTTPEYLLWEPHELYKTSLNHSDLHMSPAPCWDWYNHRTV